MKLLPWLRAVDDSLWLFLRLVIDRVENRRHGLAQSLQRFVELALDIFRGAKCRMQDLPIVMLFEIGENSCSHGDYLNTSPLVPAKNRSDFANQNSAGDSGGEDQSVGNPVTHLYFRSIEEPARKPALLQARLARWCNDRSKHLERELVPIRCRRIAGYGKAAVRAGKNRIGHYRRSPAAEIVQRLGNCLR